MRISASVWLLAGALALLTPAQAVTYQWVDEQGVTHYSDLPPPPHLSDQARRIKAPPPPAVAPETARRQLEQLEQRLQDIDQQRTEQAQEQAEAQQQAARRAGNCDAARRNLATLENRANRYLRDSEGNVTTMTEEERLRKIADSQRAIEEYCS